LKTDLAPSRHPDRSIAIGFIHRNAEVERPAVFATHTPHGLMGTTEQLAKKLSGAGALKGHGFPAVPQIFESDLRRGAKPRPSRLQPPISTFVRKL
jgi:hypothetical protein